MTSDLETEIRSFLEGDDSAFEEIVKRYLDSVYGFVYHISGDESLSEDVTQEVFIKVWKNLKKYDFKKNFKSWIFVIARNTAIDWLRKKKNISFSSFENEDGKNFVEESIEDIEPLADEIFSNKERIGLIKENIEKLPVKHKEVLFLHYYEEMTFEEIGDVLELSQNTVKSQHRRALQKLKSLVL